MPRAESSTTSATDAGEICLVLCCPHKDSPDALHSYTLLPETARDLARKLERTAELAEKKKGESSDPDSP